jgi:CO/xanthine dehydrogenase FAD-binding subunit
MLAGPVLDLSGIAELCGISTDAGQQNGGQQTGGHQFGDLRIGAATPWSEIATANLPPALWALQQAAGQVGGRQIQAAGTLGGNLCNASPAADGVPPLLALDAKVELASAHGTRRLALTEFLRGPRQTALHPGEVLVAVLIPEAALSGHSAFVKLGARSHLVISIAMVAARVVVTAGRVAEAAIAVGSCSGVATRLPKVEVALQSAPVAEAVARIMAGDVGDALSPIDDIRASGDYRQAAAVELVRRAVGQAVAGAIMGANSGSGMGASS